MDTPPLSVFRHALWGAAQHFQENIRDPGRDGANPVRLFPLGSPPQTVVEFFPKMPTRILGETELSALLSGVAPGTRERYVFNCLESIDLLRPYEGSIQMAN